ncbi:solute carrier family 13 member 5-like isoform X2 [Stegodyphus dumicola]|uniref:solute carrier family 13 member 5-like isoform X2 n=1 Tax=Stegodyphus dumicola TaxID=202533 RepID=UPI0015A80D5A|nr:solute carrier family 13 member 5-like isoform X2 [Stegodyphus dumicola]
MTKNIKTVFSIWWRPVIAILVPLVLLPLLILYDSKEARCGYVVLWMAFYFMLEPVPLAVTALLPVVTFPLLGLLSTSEACSPYMKDTIMMYVGGLTLAVAVEHCNLHKRIALRVLLIIGAGARWLMLGFMITTMFLSMWISNTATTAMMVPIVDAVLNELEKEEREKEPLKSDVPVSLLSVPSGLSPSVWGLESNKNHYQINMQLSNGSNSSPEKDYKQLRDSLLLSIAYAANCGGTGTVIGSGPNLVLKGLMEELYPKSTELTFASWLMYNAPVMVICVFICWIGLQFFYLPCCSKEEKKTEVAAKNAVLKSYRELGDITFHETAVALLFISVVLLWFLRDPQFIDGWSTFMKNGKNIRDATPVIGICVLLFIIPARPSLTEHSPPLLDWRSAQRKIPWGVLLLLGSGFVVADAAKKSHLSVWLSAQLSYMNFLSPDVIVIILTFLASVLTEVISNMSMATIMLPVVSEMAEAVKVHPLFLMLPVTIGCSFAMILPVGNPSNAIVFDASSMTTFEMMKPGVILKILCCAVELIMIQTLGVVLFNLHTYPSWANNTDIYAGQQTVLSTHIWTATQNINSTEQFNLITTLLPILQNSSFT